jgi:hypothetical protein
MNDRDTEKPKTLLVFRSTRKPLLLGFVFAGSDLPSEHGPWSSQALLSMLVYRNYPRIVLKDVEILSEVEAHRSCLLSEEDARTFIIEYLRIYGEQM